MAMFDRQDEDDDFSGGIPESSRLEIGAVGKHIHRALQEHRCLVVFHNGSNDLVDLTHFGIPQPELFDIKVLWTFRGRLRLNPEIRQKLDKSIRFRYHDEIYGPQWNVFLSEEAKEIVRYTQHKQGITLEMVVECCLYLLSLNYKGGNIMNYNWAAQASNYWVCDGIIQGGQSDVAWEVATALHQQIRLEDYSSNTVPSFGIGLETPPNRWILVTNPPTEDTVIVPRESTSFFLAVQSGFEPPLASLPNDMFHQSDKLRVLKLCRCTFSFSSPPFYCCRSLRFLGLDGCKDQRREEDEKKDRMAMEFFQSLWVLDISYTDWRFDLSPEIIEQMAANIREVYIMKGRIWHKNFAWRQLQNLHKLRVSEPTFPWQTSQMDEFTDMVKLELLDLSGNSTIQLLPSLSGATSLKTLVLDGCVGLEHVGPEGLPPSLESFALDVGARDDHNKEEAKISRISLAGCARLLNFKLKGSLQKLEELDLSGTIVKTLDLSDQEVEIPRVQRITLLGCEQLRAILWPSRMPQLSVVCIDTRGGEAVTKTSLDPKNLGHGYCYAYVAIMDMRFCQSLKIRRHVISWSLDDPTVFLNLFISTTSRNGGQSFNKDKRSPDSTGLMFGPPLLKSLIPCTYTDIAIDKITIDHEGNSAPQFQSSRRHVEIGEGISNTNVESVEGTEALIFVMDKARSLHVHDNSSITTVIPERNMSTEYHVLDWIFLEQCRVERCSKLHTVFTGNSNSCFKRLKNFWAVDLQMAHCIWSKPTRHTDKDDNSFVQLRSIHLYSCPRLKFVLPVSRAVHLRNLESLHIVYCADLRQIFPVEAEFQQEMATDHRKGRLEFPRLRHIYLHELHKLHHICEAKMFSPKLKMVKVRGCWGLRRLPAVGFCNGESHPIVDSEKDWWDKLEWDGLEAGHDPSLFQPHHSLYYKKALPRISVLR